MDFKRREEITSKDVMTIDEICELMCCTKSQASTIITEIKNKLAKEGVEPRLNIRGKIHTQDYLDFFRLTR